MKQEEYLKTLSEQIQNKRAKKLVEGEIRNHIEEQTESYEADGMMHEEAVEEAVRQMGDPVDTGIALNWIHRPKMPWLMIALALGLTIISIVMQTVIFPLTGNEWMIENGLKSTIFYNCISFLIVLVILFMDYSFIAKYAYWTYGIYLIVLMIGLIIFPGHFYFSTSLYGYGLLMLYPLVFSGIIYKNRNRGSKGVVISFLYSLLVMLCYFLAGKVIMGSGLSIPAMTETMLIVVLMLAASIRKGIFGKEKRKYAAVLAVSGGICAGFALLGVFVSARNHYMMARIQNFFAPMSAASQYEKEMSYFPLRLRESMANASMFGSKNVVLEGAVTESVSDYLLNGIFTYFGKMAGVVVLVLLLLFVIFTLRTALHQSNRISLLVGTACGMGMLVRVLVYIGMNFGYSLWWTTLIPFFSYGRTGAVVNGIYVGLILSVYRNSNILKEESGGKRFRLSVKIVEE